MDKTVFKYADIESNCEELHKSALRLKEIIDSIDKLGIDMVNNGVWVGEAAENYRNKLSKLCSNIDTNYYEIERAVVFLKKCSDDYKDVELGIEDSINAILGKVDVKYSTSKYFGGVE